jgi:hypothetical protein
LLVALRKVQQLIGKSLKQTITTVDPNLAIATCRNLKLILELDPNGRNVCSFEYAKKTLDRLLIWALAWGVGGTLSSSSLDKFDKALTDIFSPDLMPRGSVFQYYFSLKKIEGEFLMWSNILPNFEYSTSMSYF